MATIAFDDTFEELTANLKVEGHDLNCYLYYMHNAFTVETCLHYEYLPSDSVLPSHVVFVSDKSRPESSLFLLDTVPQTLLASNHSFTSGFFMQLYDLDKPIHPIDLEELTILTYKMNIVHCHWQLWQTYLRSGTGQLKMIDGYETIHLWPPEVSALLVAQKYADINDITAIDDETHTAFVKQYLLDLEAKFTQYQTEFNTIKNETVNYTEKLAYDIEAYVHRSTVSAVRLYFDAKIALVKYTFMDRVLQCHYCQQQPTDEQKHIAKRLCRRTLLKEKLLREDVFYDNFNFDKHIPTTLHIWTETLPSSIAMIEDYTIRERYALKYRFALERARVELFRILRITSDMVATECRNALQADLTNTWEEQRRLPANERLTPIMLEVIDQRRKNIIECVNHIYDLKSEFLHLMPHIIVKETILTTSTPLEP